MHNDNGNWHGWWIRLLRTWRTKTTIKVPLSLPCTKLHSLVIQKLFNIFDISMFPPIFLFVFRHFLSFCWHLRFREYLDRRHVAISWIFNNLVMWLVNTDDTLIKSSVLPTVSLTVYLWPCDYWISFLYSNSNKVNTNDVIESINIHWQKLNIAQYTQKQIGLLKPSCWDIIKVLSKFIYKKTKNKKQTNKQTDKQKTKQTKNKQTKNPVPIQGFLFEKKLFLKHSGDGAIEVSLCPLRYDKKFRKLDKKGRSLPNNCKISFRIPLEYLASGPFLKCPRIENL